MLLATCARICEVLAQQWSDLDLAATRATDRTIVLGGQIVRDADSCATSMIEDLR